MGKLLKWLQENRTNLLQHFGQKKPACTPANDWWIVISVIGPIVQRVEKTFVTLQGTNTLVCEQRKELSKLAHDLQQRKNIEGPMTQDEIESLAGTGQENPSHSCIMMDKYCVKRHKIIEAIDEAG